MVASSVGFPRPFIYIAALRRTGSTMLSEALTALPHSFIFREPHFSRNKFSLKLGDADRLRPFGVDLDQLREQWLENRTERPILTALQEELLPKLFPPMQQWGVKEIRHKNWRCYYQRFPGMKVILMGRDPRDIYISLFYRQKEGYGRWRGPYNPALVAADLNAEFQRQLEIATTIDCLSVRYEDLCQDSQAFEKIKRFVKCPLQGIGNIGEFLGNGAAGGRREYQLHGKRITTQRVRRWQVETNATLVGEAEQVFELMADYCRYWGYQKIP
ncbi:sulfotransferase [Nitrosococcus watsonii]|uniref:Sulfotransferase n=1 Tax=Nitrosococcus watsoni (strain C-113) TaxID=105559 RepID=D8K959_NITWC|nr:sulfotransferase [Nitrosococcus watsonii]ADJ29202.1 sulfotransferase [Nitrosococcus watsonii C-113]